jgi:hypothetical protein
VKIHHQLDLRRASNLNDHSIVTVSCNFYARHRSEGKDAFGNEVEAVLIYGFPTQRAPDWWESARFQIVSEAQASSVKAALSRPAHLCPEGA